MKASKIKYRKTDTLYLVPQGYKGNKPVNGKTRKGLIDYAREEFEPKTTLIKRR